MMIAAVVALARGFRIVLYTGRKKGCPVCSNIRWTSTGCRRKNT